uniref:Secreted protein n=1 Tax=Ascaris lumbricoides TaxID=6252 RepID=A0A0M3HPE8_ASCLU
MSGEGWTVGRPMSFQVALLVIMVSDALSAWKLIGWSSTVTIAKCRYSVQMILETVKIESDRARLLCSGGEACCFQRRLLLEWHLVPSQNPSLCPTFYTRSSGAGDNCSQD